jgi:hypothetical protein
MCSRHIGHVAFLQLKTEYPENGIFGKLFLPSSSRPGGTYRKPAFQAHASQAFTIQGMRQFIYSFGRSLSLLAAIMSGILHFGTFVRIVEPIWVPIPTCSLVGACICDHTVEGRVGRGVPSRTAVSIGLLLLAYATGTFIYFHKVTNRATGVTFDNGQYLSLYK